MQLPTQAQFVDNCLAKYWFTDIPPDQQWEDAHFPLPDCLGGEDTVLLWSADHTVQGLLQSVELDHRCFYYGANGKDLLNLETHYPEYLELFAQLKSQFSSRQGKKSAELGLGAHAPGKASAGGKIGGKKAVELGIGIHAPGVQSAGAAAQHSQKWQCLVTGHISTPAGLANYQKARGIDTKLRVKIN